MPLLWGVMMEEEEMMMMIDTNKDTLILGGLPKINLLYKLFRASTRSFYLSLCLPAMPFHQTWHDPPQNLCTVEAYCTLMLVTCSIECLGVFQLSSNMSRWDATLTGVPWVGCLRKPTLILLKMLLVSFQFSGHSITLQLPLVVSKDEMPHLLVFRGLETQLIVIQFISVNNVAFL